MISQSCCRGFLANLEIALMYLIRRHPSSSVSLMEMKDPIGIIWLHLVLLQMPQKGPTLKTLQSYEFCHHMKYSNLKIVLRETSTNIPCAQV